MSINLPKYTSKDYVVLALILVPCTILINSIFLGKNYYSSLTYFIISSLISAISFSIYFTICGSIAVLMKKRFPKEDQLPTRLTIMILSFLTMSGLFLLLVYNFYSRASYFNIEFNNERYAWSYIAMGIINIFITLLHEGIAQYENWKKNREETEELKKVYQNSRLQGLKSQVNPHFLFNSLNSLSSLISEDEEKAEAFLDDMSKVYRYMLRNDEDNLVQLDTELNFLKSYGALLQARFSDGLQLNIDLTRQAKERWLPPLALQTIVENAFTQNIVNRHQPLIIRIFSEQQDTLVISNNLQPKKIKDPIDIEKGLDNLVNKYKLLGTREATISETAKLRTIRLPLLEQIQKDDAI